MTLNFDFQDQNVIVTGGTRGLGQAMTKRFLDAGARVFATYAQGDDAARSFKESGQYGTRLTVAKFDVSEYADVEAFFGELDFTPHVLVNNAGIRKDAIVGMMPRESFQRVVAVNLEGTYNMSKFAVMAMSRARYGRIINIVSPSGRLGFEGQANYAASKAGQEAFAKSLAKEVARRKITVNCVSPGFIDTDLLADLSEEHKKAFLEKVPLRRFGTPEEVAAAVMFLASREAAYMTGTTVEVSGGI